MHTSHQEIISAIRVHLIQNAGGVILWVVTVLASLRDWLISHQSYKLIDLLVELERLPPNVDELYADIVQNLVLRASQDQLQLARNALRWINVATTKRPLQLQELREALSIPSQVDLEGLVLIALHLFSTSSY